MYRMLCLLQKNRWQRSTMQRQIVYQAFYEEIVASEYSCAGMDAGRKMIETSFLTRRCFVCYRV